MKKKTKSRYLDPKVLRQKAEEVSAAFAKDSKNNYTNYSHASLVSELQIMKAEVDLLSTELRAFADLSEKHTEYISEPGNPPSALTGEKPGDDEVRYHTVLENSTIGVYRSTPEGRILFVNPALVRMLGFDSEDDLKTRNLGVADIERVYPRTKFCQEIEKNGSIVGLETTWPKKDGTIINVRESAICINDCNGKVLYYDGTVEDITSHKQIEEALRASEQSFKILAEVAPVGIFRTDAEGSTRYVNPKWCEISQLLFEEAMGDGWVKAIHPDDMEKISVKWQQDANQQVVSTAEYRFLHKDGTIAWVIGQAVPQEDKNGNIVGYIGTITDISEHIKAEEQLRIKDFALDSAISAIGLADLTGALIFANRAYLQLWGYSREEIMGKPISEFADYRQQVSEVMEALQAGKPFIGEAAATKKDGTKLYLQMTANTVFSPDGRPICMMASFLDITESKHAKELLLESERNYREIFNATNEAIFVHEAVTGKIIDVNDPMLSLYGYASKDEVLCSDITALSSEVPPFIFAEAKEKIARALSSSQQTFEWHSRKKNGDLFWSEISLRSTMLGGVPRVLAVVRDVTKRKKDEEALQLSEERLRFALEGANDGIWDVNVPSRTGYMSPRGCEILGYTPQEFEKLYTYWSDLVHPEDLPKTYEKLAAHYEGKNSVFEVEQRLKMKSGEWKWILSRGKVVRYDEQGQPLRITGTHTDISAKRLIEETKNLLAHAVKSISEFVTITDKNNVILFVNEAFKKAYGYTEEELIGKSIEIVVSRNNPPDLLNKILTDTINGGWSGELMDTRKDGTEFPVSVSSSVVKDEAGNPIALIGVSTDITEAIRSREELLIAKEKAEEASHLKSSFLANMSHELRTPMIGILGYSELLEEQARDSKLQNYAKTIRLSGKRLMDTLNLILDVSRIEAGKMELNITMVDVIGIIAEVCTLFETVAKKNSLFVKMETAFKAFELYLDETMFRQIINNLINNGLKYCNHGGVLVKVYRERKGFSEYAVIQVIDTGIGIAKENHGIIFDEFRQVSEGKGRSFEGTGLGLSITKKFVEKLKGEIAVESTLGQGSTFTVRFPIAVNQQNERVIPQVKPVTVKALHKHGLPMVLYVENDPIATDLASLMLKEICRIDTAKSSQEALELVQRKQYAAIMMDINLGKHSPDGIETTRAIRKMPDYMDTPIVAVTAFAMVGDKEEFIAAGCTDYISKPYTTSQITRIMTKTLASKTL